MSGKDCRRFARFTTQEAADLLNVSRPHLIKLLEEGAINFERVGTHRRIRFEDLMEYKHKRDNERRKALKKLTQMAQEAGLYEQATLETGAMITVPFHVKAGDKIRVDTRTREYLTRVNE